MKFQLYQDKKDEWRWRLRATNGRIIASGEGYHNKMDAVAAIDLVKGSQDAIIEEIHVGVSP